MISGLAAILLGAALPVLWVRHLRRQRAAYYARIWVRLLEVRDYTSARNIYLRAESEGIDLEEEVCRG